ncbi:MAG: putative pep2 protein [Frankiales bacterium]|nr:putative pep2 protein [Frankiales bacterium]
MTGDPAALAELLAAWLPEQRWYGGKGVELRAQSVAVELSNDLPIEAPEGAQVTHLVVRAGDDRYQLLLGRRTGELDDRLRHAVIGEYDGTVAYDAVHDPAATSALLTLLAEGDTAGDLRFTHATELDSTLTGRVMTAEQSNTSVVYGDAHILKLFRRLQPGANPDIEVTKALVDAGSTHVPEPLAWFDGPVDGTTTTLGLLQTFLRGASDGWAMATASVRDLFAEGDLRADEVGGDFAGEAERLGTATAEVHALMARTLPTRSVGREDFLTTAAQLHRRLDEAVAAVPDLADFAAALHGLYDEFGSRDEQVTVQRIHGDLHLGQVLRTQEGWVLLDFEGEPARPLAERTALMHPLRDVAGMLRSFDYAARHLLAEQGAAAAGVSQLAYRAAEWAERNRQAFCDGYARTSGSDPREEPVPLRVFELDKAVYEVVYEARNRPAWLPVPLGSIRRIVEEGA